MIFTLFYRFGVRIPLRPFFAVTSVLLYYMAFVFMGKGIRELQEGNAVPITVIPGFPHVEALGLFPSVETLLAQLALLRAVRVRAAEDVLAEALGDACRRSCPRRCAPSPDAIAAIRAENEELQRRLAALEADALSCARACARAVARACARARRASQRRCLRHRARVGRARVFRRPRGAYTLRASRYCRESLATPHAAASTPSRSLPRWPLLGVSRARDARRCARDPRAVLTLTATPSDRTPPDAR